MTQQQLEKSWSVPEGIAAWFKKQVVERFVSTEEANEWEDKKPALNAEEKNPEDVQIIIAGWQGHRIGA